MQSNNFDLTNFIYGLLLLLGAVLVYKFNRFWVKEMKKKGEKLDIYDKGPRTTNEITLIFMLVFLSIVFFLKAFKLWY